MATDPVGSFSGIASGIQWRDMVTQIMAAESTRTVGPLTARQATLTNAASAWTEFQTVAGKFRDAAKSVRDATAFRTFSASANNSATTNRAVVSLSTSATAAPGMYSLEVQQLAAAEKLGGAVVASATTTLNALLGGSDGAFALNGRVVTVSTTDTITTLRDKVNALNSGTSPSGVTASILRSGAGSRLVLSSNQTGASGIELTDDASGVLTKLGFTDSSVVTSNITEAGTTQTNRFSSTSTAFTSMLATSLGIPLPTPAKIKVGDQYITVDLAVDSLAIVVARINAATGSNDSAAIVTETVGTATYSRLQTSLTVKVDARELTAGDTVNSARTLAVLGFTSAGRGSVKQVVSSANTFTDAGSEGKLTDLAAAGQSLGIGAGDTITISGKRGDGSVVTRTLLVDSGSTLTDLLVSANDISDGFGKSSRSAELSFSAGKLQLTDNTAGDSQLAMSIKVTKADLSTFSLGNFSTDNGGTAGRSRQISAGADSRFKIDDQVVTRNSNSVSDVVTGVTFNLLAAEPGTAVDVTVTRNLAGAVTAMKAFATAYNDVRTWAAANSALGKRLEGSTSLRMMVNSLSSQLLTTVTGVTGSYTTAATAGLIRDKFGTLSVDTTVLTNALTTNFEDVTRLFSQAGIASDANVTYLGSSDSTKAGTYAVQITRAATTGGVIGSAIVSPYAGAASDTMMVVDAGTGKTGSVTVVAGDSIDTTVAGLNSSFSANKMHLVASNTGGKVAIASSDYGTTGGISVSYGQGSTGEGATWVGIATGSDALTRFDVQGYIGVAGHAGEALITGSGRTLTGTTGTNAAGLQLSYTGSATGDIGTVAYSIGVGGMLYNVATSIARELDGQVAVLSKTAITQADAMSSRIQNAQDRLASRRAAMIAQFIAMESAMSKAQSVSSSLTSQINGLFNYNKTA